MFVEESFEKLEERVKDLEGRKMRSLKSALLEMKKKESIRIKGGKYSIEVGSR